MASGGMHIGASLPRSPRTISLCDQLQHFLHGLDLCLSQANDDHLLLPVFQHSQL